MADNLPVPSGSDGQLIVTVDSRQAISGLTAIEVQFMRMTNTVNTGLNNTSNAFNKFTSFIKQVVGWTAGFLTLRAAVNALTATFKHFMDRMIEVNRVYTGFIASMSIIKGSTKAAGKEYEFLLAISNRLGVQVETSITQYHRLAAALKNVDTTGELTRHIFSGISQAAVVLHARGHDVTLIFEAVQQMASKGKLSLEELQRQLGNTLPGAVSMSARAMMQSQEYVEAGIKTASQAEQKLREQIKKGTINVYEYLARFSNQLKLEYGKGVEYASDQFTANFNRMKNAIFEFYRMAGSSEAMAGLTKLIREITALFNDNAGQGALGLGQSLGAVFEDMANWVSQLDSTDVKEFFEAVNTAISSTFIIVNEFFEVFQGFGDESMQTPLLNFVEFVATSMAALVDIMKVAAAGIESTIRTALWGFNALKTPVMAVGNWTGLVSDESRASFQAGRDNNTTQSKRAINDFISGPGAGNTAYDRVTGQFAGARQRVAGEKYGVQPWALKPLDFSAQPKDSGVPKGYTFGANNAAPDWITNGAKYSRNKAGSTADAAAAYVNPLGNSEMQQLLDRIKANSGAPNAEKKDGGSDKAAKAAEAAMNKAIRNYEKMENAVSRWRGEVGITEKAEEKLKRAHDDLYEAVGKLDPRTGELLMTQTEAAEIMEKLKQKYEEALDPIGFVLRAYDKEIKALGFVGDAADEYTKILQQQEKWREDNVKFTEKDIDQLRTKIQLQAEMNRMQSAMNEILNSTRYEQRGKMEKIKAVGQLADGYTDPEGNTTKLTGGEKAQATVDLFGEDRMKGTEEYYEAQFQVYTNFLEQVEAARMQGLISDQTANALSVQSFVEMQNQKLEGIQSFLGAASGLMNTNSKKAFKLGQAAAIAQATIDTYKGAAGAWASAQTLIYPLNLVVGAAGVAMSIATGMSQISKIRSQQAPAFRTGGEMTVGGTGGIDSQLVQFYATPGERVQVNTPSQATAAQDSVKMMRQQQTSRRGPSVINLTVVQNGRADGRTPEQTAKAAKREFVEYM